MRPEDIIFARMVDAYFSNPDLFAKLWRVFSARFVQISGKDLTVEKAEKIVNDFFKDLYKDE